MTFHCSLDSKYTYELGDGAETTPAIDRNSIYIRTEKHLIAFRSKK